VSKSFGLQFLKPLTLLVGGVLLSGCSGEEKIPLKKVDFVLDVPKDFKEERKGFTQRKGTSGMMKRDPSGINTNP